ncbi:hypothetical protein EC973_006740 [Apophysomyces ossiformis]|uniref:Uncharacterized protein n=1 Tax=Apophysomyces ossiformis TaxID=679940 RepID=A0A8H7EKX9_9FUNG|nr:hypothetical protein EC973_006740 [Apophysomyces ossiformis]
MSTTDKPKTRISGIKNHYKYRKWLEEHLSQDNPDLDYFSFAELVSNSKVTTNLLYKDLLMKLSKNQSLKVMNIAQRANSIFNQRNKQQQTQFKQQYQEYWQEREDADAASQINSNIIKTVVDLNQMTTTSIINKAAELHHVEANQTTSSDDFAEELHSIIEQSNEFASDQVGSVDILDLSSPTVSSMLEEQTCEKEYDNIKSAASATPIVLTENAKRLIKQIHEAHLTTRAIKRTLIEFSYQHDIDPIIHHDAQFLDRTVTHFLDLMASPNNPLSTTILERTAAVHTTIYIINQLFLSNNDIVELAWLERECAATEKSKWDGILFKVGQRDVSIALVEFSGGFNDKTSTIKESWDIEKLYTKMLKIFNDTDPIPKAMYCVRFYANVMYFEKLCKYRGSMVRSTITSFVVPTTPRLVKKYVEQIPDLLAWKDDVVNQTLNL